MKKLIFSKYRQYFFISFALLFLTTVVFLFTNKSSLYHAPAETNEEFNKEINNFFSFFVNNNDAVQNKKTIKIKSGDSIQRILLKEEIPQSEINKIYSKIIKKYDLTDPDLRDIGWKPYHVSVFFYFYPKHRILFEL